MGEPADGPHAPVDEVRGREGRGGLGSTWTMVFELDLEGPEPVADEPLMEMEESQEAYRDVTYAKLLQA